MIPQNKFALQKEKKWANSPLFFFFIEVQYSSEMLRFGAYYKLFGGMDMKRKIFTLFVAVCLILSLFSLPASATSTFTDMPEGAYGQALQKAVDNGLLVGEDNKIMPTASLTRAQMATIISRAFGAYEKGDISSFPDVTADAWYYSSMQTAYQMGAFKGDNGRLLPNEYITREEAFVIIGRVLKLTPAETLNSPLADAGNISSWAKSLVYAMANAGYISGDGVNLRPKDAISRQDFATVFDNIIKSYIKTSDAVSSVPAGNVMVNVPNATIKNCTINGDLIIGEGVGSGDLTLDNVIVTGRIVVRGGGENSIHIKNNSQVGSLIISKTDSGAVRIVTEDGCEVEFTYIDDGKDDVILEGAFDSVSVECDVPVIAQNAAIGTVNVKAESASVKIDGTSTVANMEIASSAAGTKLEVSQNAKVTKVISNAANVAISGSGTVSEAIVGGNNTTVNTTGTKLTVSEGATGVSENGNSVSGGNTATTKPPTSGGGSESGSGGGGGGSPYYTASVATAAEFTSALSATYASAINITGSFTLTGGETPADVVVSKPVTINSGATLTVGGNINLCLESTLTNNGTIVLVGESTPHINVVIGAITVADAGILTNNGTITVKAATCDSIRYDVLTDEFGEPVLDGDGHEIHINEQGPNGGLLRINGGVINNYGTITAEQGALTADPTDAADQRYWGGYLEIANDSTLNNYSGATVNFAGACLYIWAEEGEALLDNSGTLNVTYGTVVIGDKGTLRITETGVLNNSSDEFYIGEYAYDNVSHTEYTTEALLSVGGSVNNTGTITVVQPGSNALAIFSTGSFDNDATIINNGRINVMGALNTSGALITNNGHFFVQYMEGVGDIEGKDNIVNNTVQFLTFEETDLTTALTRGYTDIIVCDEIILSQNMTIPDGTKITIEEGSSLQVPQGVILTNNGDIWLALCELAADESDQLQAELYIAGTLNNADTGYIRIADVYNELTENYSGGESVLWVTADGVVTNSGTIDNHGRITNLGSFTTTGTVNNAGDFFNPNPGIVDGIITGNPVEVPED